jgi:hypothetical protein
MQDFELQVLGKAPSDKVGVKGENLSCKFLVESNVVQVSLFLFSRYTFFQ